MPKILVILKQASISSDRDSAPSAPSTPSTPSTHAARSLRSNSSVEDLPWGHDLDSVRQRRPRRRGIAHPTSITQDEGEEGSAATGNEMSQAVATQAYT